MKWAKLGIIFGGRKHHCNAVEYLKQKGKGFTVVDIDSNCLAVKQFGLKTSAQVTSDAESFIHGDLSTALELIEALKPEYVFPTAPVHIAADLAKVKFDLAPWPEAINTILPKLPEVVFLKAGKRKLQASTETITA